MTPAPREARVSPNDNEQWYYGANGERKGPFTRDQMATIVQTGAITPDTLVWTAGMPNWLPFTQSTLAQDLPAQPPYPTPPPMAATPAATFATPRGALPPNTNPRNAAPPITGFTQAVSAAFSRYVTFSGRANRPEYWYFTLFIVLASIATLVVDTTLFGVNNPFDPVSTLFSLAIILPSLAVTFRRLHDTDRSAWWVLLSIVPLIGAIVLIVFLCQPGTPGRNRYG